MNALHLLFKNTKRKSENYILHIKDAMKVQST